MAKIGEGHIHQTLELPRGYQHFSWYKEGYNPTGLVWLNDIDALKTRLQEERRDTRLSPNEVRVYTQHQIYLEEGILKHTRSSPNWDGGFVTYSTCKHLMRTYRERWEDVWIVGLCPRDCCSNTVLFVGRVMCQFESNAHLRRYCLENYTCTKYKLACTNPRGDIYSPTKFYDRRKGNSIWNWYNHNNFVEPQNHTRSVEFYKKSPGSIPDVDNGPIPKWWRDIEYIHNGVRPPSFILAPCFLFSRPMLWTSYNPKRAALKLTISDFLLSLSSSPKE